MASTGTHKRSKFIAVTAVALLACLLAARRPRPPTRPTPAARRPPAPPRPPTAAAPRRARAELLHEAQGQGRLTPRAERAHHERQLRARGALQRQPSPGLHARDAAAQGHRPEVRHGRRLPALDQRAHQPLPVRPGRAPAQDAAAGLLRDRSRRRPLRPHHGPARRRALHELLRPDLRLQPRAAPAARAQSRRRRPRQPSPPAAPPSKARACGSGT